MTPAGSSATTVVAEELSTWSGVPASWTVGADGGPNRFSSRCWPVIVICAGLVAKFGTTVSMLGIPKACALAPGEPIINTHSSATANSVKLLLDILTSQVEFETYLPDAFEQQLRFHVR